MLSGSVAGAATPGADCQPYSGRACMFPFPDNRMTTPDEQSVTGLRLKLPAAAMPANALGTRISPAPYNQLDGFSPGSAILLHIPQLDTQAALNRTHAVGLLNMSAYTTRKAPIMVIDEQTGKRQLIYAQLDSDATSAATRDLMIMPGSNWQDGHTYVVVLRDLKSSSGHLIKAPAWFEKLRDGKRLPAAERPQAKRYAKIFKTLKRARVAQDSSLYEAWDFTVASTKQLTGRLLSIRNSAFSQLGDTDLADGQVQGTASAFSVTSTTSVTWSDGKTGTQVIGTYQVPCYLQTCGAGATTGFNYVPTPQRSSGGSLYATPTQAPGNVGTADFECIIPSSASPSNPARVLLYGHGLLGDMSEVTADPVTTLASTYNMVLCATNWWGLAAPDQAYDTQAISNLNGFPVMVDRLQQGVLNFLLLGRELDNPQGFATNAAFQQNGQSVLNTGELYYDGNSQGGIFGGLTTAVSPDIRRAVLGVTGEDYANSLVTRSTDFGAPDQTGTFAWLLWGEYAGPNGNSALYSLTLDVMDQLWDQADPVGYVEGLGSHPLPDTPTHSVLMQIAYGDHQVSMYSGAAEARSIGADAYEPNGKPASALTPGGGRSANANLFYGLKPAPLNGSYTGSVVEIWDSGPGYTQNPPVGNLAPPTNDPANRDPHDIPRAAPAAQLQMNDFLQPNGTFVNTCGGQPCHDATYVP